MPKNKFQGFIFGIIMSYAMAYGMEVYNIAIKEEVNLTVGGLSNMTNAVFLDALKEAVYMGLFVILFSNLWGNRIGSAIASKHCNPEQDNPYICQLLRQAGTIAVMCNYESGSVCSFQYYFCQRPAFSVASNLDRNNLKKFPNGLFLEYVCRSTIYTLVIWKSISK